MASSKKGGYILLAKLDDPKIIDVGRLGRISFHEGFYAYLGSALGGFKSRINRHLAKDKKPKWHIDYFLNEAKLLRVILFETSQKLECSLSQALANELPFTLGFGSTDCHCQSHLYFAKDRPTLELSIQKAISQITAPERALTDLTKF
jgi:Uri superfamily endonuclease